MSEAVAAARAIHVLLKAGVQIDFEPVLQENYQRFLAPGDFVIDVGAHTGKHLKPMLEAIGPTGRAIAVEPQPKIFTCLKTDYGHIENVTLYNLALSNFDGTTTFQVATNAPEESGLRRKLYNVRDVELEEIEVEVARLDTLLLDAPEARFIKIDVEGAELLLFDGAREYLARARPILSVEYGSPSFSAYDGTKRGLFEFASSLSYSCADLYGNLIDTVEEWDKICDWVYWDYLLIPFERRTEFMALFAR